MADLFDLGSDAEEIERVLCVVAETHVRDRLASIRWRSVKPN